MKIQGLTAYIIVENVEKYNNSYLDFIKKVEKNRQFLSIWSDGDELFKNISTKIFQNDDFKNHTIIKFPDYSIHTFEVGGKYYISKHIDDNKYIQTIIKSTGLYEYKTNIGYDRGVYVISEEHIQYTFDDYSEFITKETQIKLEANNSNNERKLHHKHIDMVNILVTKKI